MMDLKTWLQEQMGDEYRNDMTTSQNVKSLIVEIKSLRELANIVRDYTCDLIDWLEDDGTENVHEQREEHGDRKESEQEPVDSRS